MNTKTVEEHRQKREELYEEFKKGYPETIGETDKHFDTDNFVDFLVDKFLTPSPERGKEGKTDVLTIALEKYPDVPWDEIHEFDVTPSMKRAFFVEGYEYAQSTSKPVNNETSLEKILEKWGCKIFNEVAVLDGLNLNQQDRFYNAIKEYHNMMCSKMPVEPKTRVTEDIIKRAAEILLQAEDKGITSCQQKMRIVFETLNTEGLSLNQESAEREEWISVEERIPDRINDLVFSKDVLVIEEDEEIKVTCWDFEYNRFVQMPHAKKITHWMPLPKFTQTKGEE